MLNFRFHIVSLVAVFLALAIGIIMGSTVIDRALVDTLEEQQQTLRSDLDRLQQENAALRAELEELRSTTDRLAEEGAERLLQGTLADVPVVLVAVRGTDASAVEELEELLLEAGADDRGTLWLADRLALGAEEDVATLQAVLNLSDGISPEGLRATVVRRMADTIRDALERAEREAAGEPVDAVPPGPGEPGASLELLVALRDAGFLDYDAPEGEADDVTQVVAPGMAVVVVSGPGAAVADSELAAPLARALVDRSTAVSPPVPVLAAEPSPEGGDADEEAGLVELLRSDDVQDRLSTVDNLDSFAGRLAAVIAVQDLQAGRRGHYGDGPGAERLIPAPQG